MHKLLIIWVLFSNSLILFPQGVDSLSIYSDEQLIENMGKHQFLRQELSVLHSEELINRGRRQKDSTKLFDALYYALKYSKPRSRRIEYAKELLEYSNRFDLGYRSGLVYFTIGRGLHVNEKYEEALEQYFKAELELAPYKNLEEYLWIKQSIANIKFYRNDFEAAKKMYTFLIAEHKKNDKLISYAYSSANLGAVFLAEKQIDSAEILTKQALEHIDGRLNHSAIFNLNKNYGIIEHYKKNYRSSIDKLEPLLIKYDSLNDEYSLSHTNYYLGKSYFDIKDTLGGLQYFNNSIKYKDLLFRSSFDSYVQLSKYYYKIGDTEKELETLKNIIYIDSAYAVSQRKLATILHSDYDLPNYLQRKDELIAKINSKQEASNYIIYGVFGVLVLLSIFFVWNIRNAKQKQFKYQQIINTLKEKQEKPKAKQHHLSGKTINILDDLLVRVETNKEYLNAAFNKSYIIKHTGINSHHVSDYFNNILDQTITEYTNGKRIDHAIYLILKDKSFAKYTMNAMSETLGFSSSTSFKRAFKKEKGLNPLDFIEEMNSQKDN